jgi:hypothetical protein
MTDLSLWKMAGKPLFAAPSRAMTAAVSKKTLSGFFPLDRIPG